MKNTNQPTICYNCKHRCNIPGDAHSRCSHPETKTDDNPLQNIIGMLASVGRVDPQIGTASSKLNIQANEHGIKSGWFNWPWNFDPIWLENCDGFEAEEN
jgi:hypothetical protein